MLCSMLVEFQISGLGFCVGSTYVVFSDMVFCRLVCGAVATLGWRVVLNYLMRPSLRLLFSLLQLQLYSQPFDFPAWVVSGQRRRYCSMVRPLSSSVRNDRKVRG